MKSKRKTWAFAAAPIIFLLLLIGGQRGLDYLLSRPNGEALADTEGVLSQQNKRFHNRIPPPSKLHFFAPADKATNDTLQKLVSDSLAAFRKKDYTEATRFWYSVYSRKETPDQLARSHARQCPELENADSVSYEIARVKDTGTSAYMPLMVQDAHKHQTHFWFSLEREMTVDSAGRGSERKFRQNGEWLISDCVRGIVATTGRTRQ